MHLHWIFFPHHLPSLLEAFLDVHNSQWEEKCICLPLLESVLPLSGK
jgi:hypothetical protein